MKTRLAHASKEGMKWALIGTGAMTVVTPLINQNVQIEDAQNVVFDSSQSDFGLKGKPINKQEVQDFLRKSFIIKQAYKDSGCTNEVVVRFKRKKPSGFNMRAFPTFNRNWRIVINVVVINDHDAFRNDTFVYAAAAHEAAHWVRRHLTLALFMSFFTLTFSYQAITSVRSSLMLRAYCGVSSWIAAQFVFQTVRRHGELDADLWSAKKLGTGTEMKAYLKSEAIFENLLKLHQNESMKEPLLPQRLQKALATTKLSGLFERHPELVLRYKNLHKDPHARCKLFEDDRLRRIEAKTKHRMKQLKHTADFKPW